jgi:hypothetical protein
MKIRTGFVSNSSSSNFIIQVPKGTTEEEILLMVEKHIGDMKGFFIPTLRQDMIETIMECKGDKADLEADLKFEVNWINDNPDSSTTERDRLQELIDRNVDRYEGGFSDNGDGPLQNWLCDTNFKIIDGSFTMINEAGY